MLDLSPIDVEAERLARSLPEVAREAERRHPIQIDELDQLLQPLTWTGVSWAHHWGYTSTFYHLWMGCREALQRIANELGVGSCLLEAVLPDFGFASGDIEVPYGRRGNLRLRLMPGNNLEIWLDGRLRSSLPQPLAGDDPAVLATRTGVLALKQEIRRIDRLLRKHFEKKFGIWRETTHWTIEQWQAAMANPLYRDVAADWLWVGSGPPTNRPRQLFAIDESGEPVNLDDSPLDVTEFDVIRLASRELLTPDLCHRWSTWFAEHERHAELRPQRRRGPTAATHMSYCGYLEHLHHGQVGAAKEALEWLGWEMREPLGSQTGRRWQNDTQVLWAAKQLPGDITGCVFAEGRPEFLTRSCIAFAHGEEFLTLDTVPPPIEAEVLLDLSWANRVARELPGSHDET